MSTLCARETWNITFALLAAWNVSSWAMGRLLQPTRQCLQYDREPDVLRPVLERPRPQVLA